MANADNGSDEQAPSAASNIAVADRTASSLTVSWDAATDTGGSGLDRYAVTVDGSVVRTVDAPTTRTTVSGLSADTGYDVGVTAFDGANNESYTVVTSAATEPADSDGSGTGSGSSGETGSGSGDDTGSGSSTGADSDSGTDWWGSGSDSGSDSGSGSDSDAGSGWWSGSSGSDPGSDSDSGSGWW